MTLMPKTDSNEWNSEVGMIESGLAQMRVETVYPTGPLRKLDDLREELGGDVSLRLLREIDDLYVLVNFEVPGEPVSKSRARHDLRKTGRVYNPEKNQTAEEKIGWLFRQAVGPLPPNSEDGFGVLVMFYTITRQRRDVDNMLKLVMDALTGLAWKDDSQVTEVSGRIMRGAGGPARSEITVYYTYRDPPPRRLCAVCNLPFKLYESTKNSRYCSRTCSGKARTTSTEQKCKHCDKVFVLPPTRIARNQVYCSRSCRSAAASVTLLCKQCSKPFIRPQSVAAQRPNEFCSEECRTASWKIFGRRSRTDRP